MHNPETTKCQHDCLSSENGQPRCKVDSLLGDSLLLVENESKPQCDYVMVWGHHTGICKNSERIQFYKRYRM